MKTNILMLCIALISFSLSSCKIHTDDKIDNEDPAAQTTQSADEFTFQMESEIALSEINTAISGSSLGKTATIAGASVNDSTWIDMKQVVIHYNGKSADNKRNRVGLVIVTLISGANWGEKGAVLTIDFEGLDITYLTTGKKVSLNGSLNITNISGGRITMNSSVTHRIRGKIQFTFDDGETNRVWNVACNRFITTTANNYTITIEGDTSINGLNNIVAWGLNRFNQTFFTRITHRLVISSDCPGKIISGKKIHTGNFKDITVDFGVDMNGNPVSGTCPYGFKISWTDIRNAPKAAIISY